MPYLSPAIILCLLHAVHSACVRLSRLSLLAQSLALHYTNAANMRLSLQLWKNSWRIPSSSGRLHLSQAIRDMSRGIRRSRLDLLLILNAVYVANLTRRMGVI